MLMKFMKMMRRKNNSKGFTLVELMVVVVIIGILVAIAVPVYNNATATAQKNANMATARTILGAVSIASAINNVTAAAITADMINDNLNNPKIVISATASASNPWTVNYSGNVWHVYHFNGTSSEEIKPE